MASDQQLTTKQKAIQEARTVQALVEKECADAGRDPPPYDLAELIGKGSFGRVYKAKSRETGKLVAIKIISIDEGDSYAPGQADTFNDILKEVNTLKRLNEGGAKNINLVIDSLLIGPTIWIVTEYCAGGSVATLMRPTNGLQEKYIIPILREVAEAIYWVHKQGVIHRDIKCANVLIGEAGQVQLCDFGVAGIIETKFDKRSTVTGSLQWMAPELFDSTVSYGSEVDIWAFGSMAYEMATGLPPNARPIVDITEFGAYLKQHCPRLTGDQYSEGLKDLIAFCLVDDPRQRPPIEQIQRHHYIYNTEVAYPTSSLAELVEWYKAWELQGGSRRSLFTAGGAQAPLTDRSSSGSDDGWNFDIINEETDLISPTEGIRDHDIPLEAPLSPKQDRWRARRRRPPPNIRPLKVPLEKVFDPNTITSYTEAARAFYGKGLKQELQKPASSPPPQEKSSSTDLPLRDKSDQQSVRESLIDLDASLEGMDSCEFSSEFDMTTIKPIRRPDPPPIDTGPAEGDRGRTLDWTFPSATPSSEPQSSLNHNDNSHHGIFSPVDSVQVFTPLPKPAFSTAQSPPAAENRFSAVSLIDLDDATPDPDPSAYRFSAANTNYSRPSTSHSEVPSTISSDRAETPFGFDLPLHQHNDYSYEHPSQPTREREPSIYIDADVGVGESLNGGEEKHLSPENSISISSEPPPTPERSPLRAVRMMQQQQREHILQSRQQRMRHRELQLQLSPEYKLQRGGIRTGSVGSSMNHGIQDKELIIPLQMPAPKSLSQLPIPTPPSPLVMQGMSSPEKTKEELNRLIASFCGHLQLTGHVVESLPVRVQKDLMG
ncbi:uncharacterized protein CTHT_0052710 [Thermochaetoides thermophila DSM 1495]|uniref:non-specific serine/threonine protein kinase n=1 Tax=Chaetomium thermophilum (strain DSM 1495 / CBS 144.50 / IMI 039719) TaxID=759272 RepID=G0SDR4_CHATD|nr:hypothetical protein CTHT_0052710 [Thermochaetoides thermophila DSM 1495]EGS18665.1 hypothetical protein CTHT_0052710 [Thermochaetoides thermophila DSM 1495]